MSSPAIQDQNASPAQHKTGSNVASGTPTAPPALALEEIQLAHVSSIISAAADQTAYDVEEKRGKVRVVAIFTALAVSDSQKKKMYE
jgi:hypothetical protein